MAKKCATLLALVLTTTFLPMPDAVPSIMTFTASTGGSANFTGNSTKFLQVTNNSINIGASDFTISWWQKSIANQSPWPRILQFGHDREYENKFAISEEGNLIILWINGMEITSIPNPNPESSAWNHIAITRVGLDYSWFLNGVFVKTTNFSSGSDSFSTTNLDLLIGSGDDSVTGGYTGNLAGVQISQIVRWAAGSSFTPPTNFQNPGTDFVFSMYVSESAVVDKSASNLLVMPIVTSYGELADDFNPPNAPLSAPTGVTATNGDDASTTVSWVAPVSDGGSAITEYSAKTASGQTCTSSGTSCIISGLTNDRSYTFTVTATNAIGTTSAPSSASASITPTSPIPIVWEDYPSKIALDYAGQETFTWDSELLIYKEESAPYFDFGRINYVSIGVPVSYLSNSTLVSTICYLDMTEGLGNFGENDIEIVMTSFHSLVTNLLGSTCDGHAIPDYQHGMLGETQTVISLYLWTQENVPDFTAVENAFEELQITMALPPQISGQSITRGQGNSETDIGRISFGDTITVTIENEAAISNMAMIFLLPESGADQNYCRYYLDPIADSNIYGRTFALPTLEDLLIDCYLQFQSEEWSFDEEAEHYFAVIAYDENDNYVPAPAGILVLNPTMDWSLYPSGVEVSYPTWNKTYTFSKGEAPPYFDWDRITDITIGVPVTYVSNSTDINTVCYWELDSRDEFGVGENGLWLDLPEFGYLRRNLDDCGTVDGSEIPAYRFGMFGQSQTAISVYFWTYGVYDSDYLSDSLEDAFEVVSINVKLPPLISGHTITRIDDSEIDVNMLHTGDTVHFTFANSSSEIESLEYIVELPEASDYLCWVNIEPNLAGVFGESWTVPSAAEIYASCHGDGDNQVSGDWIFDQSIARGIGIGVDDIHGNGIPSYWALSFTAQTTSSQAPPTEEPTPPKKITPEEPTPQQEIQPTPPAPEPTPTPDQKVITPEPVVAVAEKPIKGSLVAKACVKAGVWIFTKNNLLQICDTDLKIVLAIPACTGKKTTPTYPWLFKAQRFKPGYSSTQSGQKLYYSVFFYKGLAIAGVEKVSNAPCSNGSVFIEKKHAKKVYDYIAENKSLIWVKS